MFNKDSQLNIVLEKLSLKIHLILYSNKTGYNIVQMYLI